MKYKSRAIALNYLKQGESSIIAKIFTEEKGLQSFIVKGVRAQKAKKKLGLFQPLQLLNINATHITKNSLQYISEITIAHNQVSDGIDMKKNFISIFVAEVISKVLLETEKDKALFKFIWELKNNLSNFEKINPNFALIFLIGLSEQLGFLPSKDQIDGDYFNLEFGEFTNNQQQLNHFIKKENSYYLRKLLENKDINIPYKNRNKILLHLIQYYKLQHHELKNMTSHLIIESLRT
ncbi:MAG: recombination protein O N-terminal domain-containing protein [Cryomorphaceae bacterium]|nr:recombination protein O N-terminal domain-containing protein [Cryomorphaceae bacterium]